MLTPAKLQYITSFATSKIFWTQVIMVFALMLGASGVHVLDDPLQQAELVAGISGVMTVIFRVFFSSGPVSMTGPMSSPPSQDIPAGNSVISVPPPQETTQTVIVSPVSR